MKTLAFIGLSIIAVLVFAMFVGKLLGSMTTEEPPDGSSTPQEN